MKNKPLFLLASLPFLVGAVGDAEAQGTAFTYQGRLTDNGGTANGIYDLRCTIYDLAGGGSAIAGPLTNANVAVSNGLFTTVLDFGAAAFSGADRWLEIGVRTNGSRGDFTTLTPRQPITPTAYALFAGKAAMLAENASQTFTGAVGFNPSTPGAPPFTVGSSNKITNLNADLFDGLDSTNFLLKSEHCLTNIAELKARAAGFVSCVTVLGYYAPGDGGGGNFLWVPLATEADNGGTVIVPASNPSMGRWKRMGRDPLSVLWFGAKGDGSGNDTDAFQRAITAAANSVLWIPNMGKSYRLTNTLDVASPIQIISDHATNQFAIPLITNGAALFSVHASNVTFDGLTIDATGLSYTTDTVGNRHAILISGTPTQRLRHVTVKNCKFINLRFRSNDPHRVIATHCIYNTYSDYFVAEHNEFEAPSGAAIFTSFADHTRVLFNDIRNTGWYSVQYQQACRYVEIHGNTIVGTDPGIRSFGGSINLMSDGTNAPRITHVNISENYISGEHSYSTAISVSSAAFVNIANNVIDNVTYIGAQDINWVSYIRVDTRGIPHAMLDNKGPAHHITVDGNILIAGGTNNIGIYVDNQDYDGGVAAGAGFIATHNQILSPNEANYFRHGIILHGQQGGWNGVTIANNYVQGIPRGQPVDGMIGVIGFPAKPPVNDVTITGNTVQFLGIAANSEHIGIWIGENTDRVIVDNNSVNGCFYGLRTDTNVSHFTLGQNQIKRATNTLASDLLFAALPTKGQLSGSNVWSTGPIPSSGFANVMVAVAGAVPGDAVAVGFTPALPDGTLVTGTVTGTNIVTASVHNLSPVSIPPANGTVYVEVFKH